MSTLARLHGEDTARAGRADWRYGTLVLHGATVRVRCTGCGDRGDRILDPPRLMRAPVSARVHTHPRVHTHALALRDPAHDRCSAGGHAIHLAARTYRTSTPIVPKAGDRLIGAGEGVTVFGRGGCRDHNGIDTMGGIADVLVADLTVTGFNDGIRLGPAWQVTGVEATRNVTGLQFAGFAGATITDASAHDNGRFGIHGSSDQGQVISSDVFRNHTDASWPSGFSGGLKLVNCTGVAVRNTSIHDNYGVGCGLTKRSTMRSRPATRSPTTMTTGYA